MCPSGREGRIHKESDWPRDNYRLFSIMVLTTDASTISESIKDWQGMWCLLNNMFSVIHGCTDSISPAYIHVQFKFFQTQKGCCFFPEPVQVNWKDIGEVNGGCGETDLCTCTHPDTWYTCGEGLNERQQLKECIENMSNDNRFVVGGWVPLLLLRHKRTRWHILPGAGASFHFTFKSSLTTKQSRKSCALKQDHRFLCQQMLLVYFSFAGTMVWNILGKTRKEYICITSFYGVPGRKLNRRYTMSGSQNCNITLRPNYRINLVISLMSTNPKKILKPIN